MSKRLHAADAARRFERDARHWRRVNASTLVITTKREAEGAAALADHAAPSGTAPAQVASRAATCAGCGKSFGRRPPSDHLCGSCRRSIECLQWQHPRADHAALVVELREQLRAFSLLKA